MKGHLSSPGSRDKSPGPICNYTSTAGSQQPESLRGKSHPGKSCSCRERRLNPCQRRQWGFTAYTPMACGRDVPLLISQLRSPSLSTLQQFFLPVRARFTPKTTTWDKLPHLQSPPSSPSPGLQLLGAGLCSTRCAAAGNRSQTSPAFAGEAFCSLARLIFRAEAAAGQSPARDPLNPVGRRRSGCKVWTSVL